jgi:hypothetical protein
MAVAKLANMMNPSLHLKVFWDCLTFPGRAVRCAVFVTNINKLVFEGMAYTCGEKIRH